VALPQLGGKRSAQASAIAAVPLLQGKFWLRQPVSRYNLGFRAGKRLSVFRSPGFKSPQALYRFHPFFQEPAMAVQQNKKSPSKRGMHRSHNALDVPGIAVEPTTGEIHLRHHISPNGFYRGRQVLKNKSEA
jgi:large subunit ribosomal protein L32